MFFSFYEGNPSDFSIVFSTPAEHMHYIMDIFFCEVDEHG